MSVSYLNEQGLITFWQKVKEKLDMVLPSSDGAAGMYLTYGTNNTKAWRDIPGITSLEVGSIVSSSLGDYGFLGTPGDTDLWTKITSRYNS